MKKMTFDTIHRGYTIEFHEDNLEGIPTVEEVAIHIDLKEFYDPGKILNLEERVDEMLLTIRKKILADFRAV